MDDYFSCIYINLIKTSSCYSYVGEVVYFYKDNTVIGLPIKKTTNTICWCIEIPKHDVKFVPIVSTKHLLSQKDNLQDHTSNARTIK